MTSPKDAAPADALLDALAAELAPRVARILREDASKDDDRAIVAEVLASVGWEIDDSESEPAPVPKPPRKAKPVAGNGETCDPPRQNAVEVRKAGAA